MRSHSDPGTGRALAFVDVATQGEPPARLPKNRGGRYERHAFHLFVTSLRCSIIAAATSTARGSLEDAELH